MLPSVTTMPNETKIAETSWISISVAVAGIGMAVSFGAVYQKVQTLAENVTMLNITVTQTREQLIRSEATNSQILEALSGIRADVNDLKKTKSR